MKHIIKEQSFSAFIVANILDQTGNLRNRNSEIYHPGLLLNPDIIIKKSETFKVNDLIQFEYKDRGIMIDSFFVIQIFRIEHYDSIANILSLVDKKISFTELKMAI